MSNINLLLNLSAIILIILSFIVIFIREKNFKKTNKELAKYPFYKFRDEIVHKILAEKAENPETIKDYKSINWIINNLKIFGWQFYSKTINYFFSDLFSKAEISYSLGRLSIAFPKSEVIDENKIKIGRIILQTAKKNSILLKLATTKIGSEIVWFYYALRYIVRLGKKVKDTPQKYELPQNIILLENCVDNV